ncbi:isoleucine--tRNA ligase [Patescibacteria group bacterium]|nr:isoleucine--tRNA ligase [Patescibacteria group bacterium]
MEINDVEEEILKFWNKNKIFEKSLIKTKSKKPYLFYDGPPFATGTPHYGHILGSVTKDIFGRFWTMKGKYVRRVWGWDCHGLPVENIAEKGLKINSKTEIRELGVKKFNEYCKNSVMGYSSEWKKVIERIARWVDMDKAYKTMDKEYIESVWWAFKQLWEKGFIYEGEKVLMYCPRCSTPLAKAEIAMDNSYRTIKEDSIVVKFKLLDEDVYALAWTTTPWTLPSNLALTINPSLNYVYLKDKSDEKTYLLVKDVIDKFFKSKDSYDIIKEIKGKDLENKRYEPLFPYFKDTPNAFRFLLGKFVTAEDGTGIVHTAPAFGEDDYEICKKNNIPLVNPIDDQGKFQPVVKDFKGRFVHDSNQEIINFLKRDNKIVLIKKTEHEYPFCCRCDTKLIYRAIPAWFVDIQKIKPRLLEISQKINWYPSFLKKGRVRYTIETAPDWNISRNRYWASAMPVWVSVDGEKLVIGSIDELKKYAKNLKGEINLHKDYLDELILEKNGKEFKRIPEVLDCWFESGAMTFAQFHYPFENKELFKKSFPSDFVAEYIAQVRTWFYYMMVLSAILFDEAPFENVVTTGTILAEDGQKMSKSKNNFTDPMILIKKYGVDALRFYLMSSSVMNAEDINFSDKGVEEVYRKVILILYNVLRFYEITRKEEKIKNPLSKNLTDKWIISRLNDFGIKINQYLEDYDTLHACVEIKSFVEDLSTWYVRINRNRFEEEKNAIQTLGYVLDVFSKTIAPVLPFVSEEIFHKLNPNLKSVHLENFPRFDKKKIEKKISEKMTKIREIISLGLRERDKIGIGLKWPLLNANISIDNFILNKEEESLIKEQLNVKKLTYSKGIENNKILVELDSKVSKDLEAEGYAREISRKVQDFRKSLGLEKKEKIKLLIVTDKEFKEILDQNLIFIKERTNSVSLEIIENKKLESEYKENFKNKIRFSIKDKRGDIVIIITAR